MNPKNLSRSELISHLQGKPRNVVLETCLALHASQNNKQVGAIEVPKGTAIGMANLASAPERMKIRKDSPDLFDRKPFDHEITAGRATLMEVYRDIDISERGGAEKRRDFRNRYPKAFQ